MTPRTPQCKVFWALLSSFEHSGVPEDSKSPTLEVLGFTPPHLAKVGLRHLINKIRVVIDVTKNVDGNFLGLLLEKGVYCHYHGAKKPHAILLYNHS